MWEEALASMGVNSTTSKSNVSGSRSIQGNQSKKSEEFYSRNQGETSQNQITKDQNISAYPQDQQQKSKKQRTQLPEQSNSSKSSSKKRKRSQVQASVDNDQLNAGKDFSEDSLQQTSRQKSSVKNQQQTSQSIGRDTSRKRHKKQTKSVDGTQQLTSENQSVDYFQHLQSEATPGARTKQKKRKLKKKKKKLKVVAELLEQEENEGSNVGHSAASDKNMAEQENLEEENDKVGQLSSLNRTNQQVETSTFQGQQNKKKKSRSTSSAATPTPTPSDDSLGRQQSRSQQNQEMSDKNKQFSTDIWSDMLKEMGIQNSQNRSSSKLHDNNNNNAETTVPDSLFISENRRQDGSPQLNWIAQNRDTSSNSEQNKSGKKKRQKTEGSSSQSLKEQSDKQNERDPSEGSRKKKRKRKDAHSTSYIDDKENQGETSYSSLKSKSLESSKNINENSQTGKSKSKSSLETSSSIRSQSESADQFSKKIKKRKRKHRPPSQCSVDENASNVQHVSDVGNGSVVIDLTDDSQEMNQAPHQFCSSTQTDDTKNKDKKKKKKKKKQKSKSRSPSRENGHAQNSANTLNPTDVPNVSNVDVTNAEQEYNAEELDTSEIRKDIQPLKDVWTETLEQMGVVNQNKPTRKKYPYTQQQNRTYQQFPNQQSHSNNIENNRHGLFQSNLNQVSNLNIQQTQHERMFQCEKQQNAMQVQVNEMQDNVQSVGNIDGIQPSGVILPSAERWRNFFIEKYILQESNHVVEDHSAFLISGVGGQTLPKLGQGQGEGGNTPGVNQSSLNTNNKMEEKGSRNFGGIQCDFIEPRKRRVRVRRRRQYRPPILYNQKDETWWFTQRHGYVQPQQLPGTNPYETRYKKWKNYERFLVSSYATKVRKQYQGQSSKSSSSSSKRKYNLYNLGINSLPENVKDDSLLREYMDYGSSGAVNRHAMNQEADQKRADLKRGDYSSHEVALADAAFRMQLKKYKIPESRWMEAFAPHQRKTFWKEVASSLPHRSVHSVRVKLKFLYIYAGQNRGRFSPDEDKWLKRLVEQIGPDFMEIGKIMKRPFIAVRKRYKLITGLYTSGRWSDEEVAKLEKLIRKQLDKGKQDGDLGDDEEDEEDTFYSEGQTRAYTVNEYLRRDGINWKSICSQMQGRTAAQCHFKYYRSIAPSMVEKGEWGKGEDRIMLYEMAASGAQAEFQVDWGNLIKGRDRQTVLRRWKLMKKAVPFYKEKPFRFILDSLIDQFCPEVLGALDEEENDTTQLHE